MSIRERVEGDLKAAIKSGNEMEKNTLRNIRAEILKHEKSGSKEPIDDGRMIEILSRLSKQRRESIEQFERGNRPDLVATEQAELEVLSRYLPESVSDEQIDETIRETIEETGASSPRDMGKVMGQVVAKLKATGRPFDAGNVSARVKEKLGA